MAALEDAAIEEDWSSLEWPEFDCWPDLPRTPAQPEPGSDVVLGRKFCATCGRWRHVFDFHRGHRTCKTCKSHERFVRQVQKPYSDNLSCGEAIFAERFFRWFDGWLKRHEHLWVGNVDEYATPLVTENTIMEAVGSHQRTLSRARSEGRISRALVDRILVVLDAEVQLWELEA